MKSFSVKTFFYQVETLRTTKGGYREKRVTLWEIKKNDIAGTWSKNFSFLDDGQAARELAEELGLCKKVKREELTGVGRLEYRDGFCFYGGARFKQI